MRGQEKPDRISQLVEEFEPEPASQSSEGARKGEFIQQSASKTIISGE